MKTTFFSVLAVLSIAISFSSIFPEENRLQTFATEAQNFCVKNDLNTQFFILVDMRIHSGKNRLFLYDFNLKKTEIKGLCSHGCCDKNWGKTESKDKPTFSNEHESHCTALGKYKIGARGWSNWGININYKMHGIEPTNSNAYNRYIVLHSWNEVSESEVYPEGTPEGWGCPAVANATMRQLDEKLKNAEKPVLLWIVY